MMGIVSYVYNLKIWAYRRWNWGKIFKFHEWGFSFNTFNSITSPFATVDEYTDSQRAWERDWSRTVLEYTSQLSLGSVSRVIPKAGAVFCSEGRRGEGLEFWICMRTTLVIIQPPVL
jgi:hypothetical protein